MTRAWFGKQSHQYITLAMRVLQLASAVLALGFIAGGFDGKDEVIPAPDGDGKKKMLVVTMHFGGPTVNFAMIVTYSAAIYAMLWIAFVYATTRVRVPAHFSVALDSILTVMLLSAGCAVAASDYVRYCSALTPYVHCSSLKAGVAFCFLAFVAFLISVAWGLWILRERLADTKKAQRPQVTSGASTTDQIDVLECSPSSDASNAYHNAAFVC
uniref:MARVEL domain-containing protein n=1 Tax=Globisporangium ultimum (strain ATCC 200006 / CBS 805.95 / DAOM BR144) TaxID=431595 RepID=K3X3G8_GLOUD